jgi:glutaredoxin-related protein
MQAVQIAATMDEDLSELYENILEDERRRRYLKEISDWLVEEYFEPRQAS